MRKHPLVIMALVVAALVAVGHAWSISAGLFLDDHAHYRQLREGDWSYRSAVAAARLGIVGDVMDLWSRHETGLRFYRPVAFWIMRAEYTVAGWRPAVMHIFSITWHWLCAMLVGVLAWRLVGRWTWAGVAACIMAVHPGHVVTVYWIACQTELMTTAFILLATLCYAQYAGWWRRDMHTATLDPRLTKERLGEGIPSEEARLTPTARRWVWLLAALACYALAMGCREHAIMWPAVIVAGDVAFRANWRRHARAYILTAALAVGYLLARQEALHGFPLPGHPYLMRPTDPGFVRYIIDKFIYYIIGLFGYVPVLPIGGTEYFRHHPGAFYGTFAAVVAGILLIVAGARSRRELLFPLTWTAIFFVPLLPVFASMHHLYLPGVGMAWLAAIGLATLAGSSGGPRGLIAWTLVGVNIAGLGFLTWAFGWAYRAATRVEDVVVRDVIQSDPTLHDGDDLFFINMPMLAYYAIPAIESQTGLRNLHGHVLTFSPWLLRMEAAGAVERPDDHTVVVMAPAGSGYFAGAAGRTILTIMGLPEAFKTGDRVNGDLFDVQIMDAEAGGTRRLRFSFHGPTDSQHYHFFLGSPVRWAYALPKGV
jgi:uncharacterized membrane protein